MLTGRLLLGCCAAASASRHRSSCCTSRSLAKVLDLVPNGVLSAFVSPSTKVQASRGSMGVSPCGIDEGRFKEPSRLIRSIRCWFLSCRQEQCVQLMAV